MRPVRNRVADIMPARALRIAVLCAVEIHADAKDIIALKYLVDADIAIKLQLSRIHESGIIEGDRAVDILAACHREHQVSHLRLLCWQEFHGNILRRQALRLLKPLLTISRTFKTSPLRNEKRL